MHHFANLLRLLLILVLGLAYESAMSDSQSRQGQNKAEQKDGKVLSLQEVRTLQDKLKDTSSLAVDFSQEVYKDLRKKTSLSYGKAYFSKPNRFRWVLEKPKADEWIFDGKELIHFQPERKQALRYSSAAAKGRELRQIVDMVLNFDALLSHYKLQEAIQKNNEIALSLEPLKADDIVKAELTLDLVKNYISTVCLHFRGGNHTTFNFSNPRKDKLDDSLFAAPSGVKISNAL